MKTLILSLLMLTVPISAYAVDSETIASALKRTQEIQVQGSLEIAHAVKTIIKADPLNQKRKMTQMDIVRLAFIIERVAIATSVDWKLLLAISYVETNLCQDNWMKGDKKLHTKGYWAIGCMQVHTLWWGNAISKAGISNSQLLEHETGILIGALILKQKVDRYGWREGIKRYNGSGTKSDIYRAKVLKAYKLLV